MTQCRDQHLLHLGEFLWDRAFGCDTPIDSAVSGLNSDDCSLHSFFLLPKPNQRCIPHYVYRLHSESSAWTNKCYSSTLLSPQWCLRLDPVATSLPFIGSLSLGNTQVPPAIMASNDQVLPDQLHDSTAHPAYPHAGILLSTCSRCSSYLFPSHEGKDQISLGNSYSKNMCVHSWCKAKFRPKARSKPLVLWPQSWACPVKTTLPLSDFFHFEEEISHIPSTPEAWMYMHGIGSKIFEDRH